MKQDSNSKNIRRAVAMILQRTDGRVLLIKRSKNRKYDAGKWCVPSGHIEPGETPKQAAIRELKEELNIDLIPVKQGKKVVIDSYSDKPLHIIPFLFKIGEILHTYIHTYIHTYNKSFRVF